MFQGYKVCGLSQMLLVSMNVWQRKTFANFPWEAGKFLFAFFMSLDIMIWMVKFGELSVIHQGFPLPKLHTIWYFNQVRGSTANTVVSLQHVQL